MPALRPLLRPGCPHTLGESFCSPYVSDSTTANDACKAGVISLTEALCSTECSIEQCQHSQFCHSEGSFQCCCSAAVSADPSVARAPLQSRLCIEWGLSPGQTTSVARRRPFPVGDVRAMVRVARALAGDPRAPVGGCCTDVLRGSLHGRLCGLLRVVTVKEWTLDRT